MPADDVFARTLASNVDSMREWSDKTSGVVSRTNALLEELGTHTIDWRIP